MDEHPGNSLRGEEGNHTVPVSGPDRFPTSAISSPALAPFLAPVVERPEIEGTTSSVLVESSIDVLRRNSLILVDSMRDNAGQPPDYFSPNPSLSSSFSHSNAVSDAAVDTLDVRQTVQPEETSQCIDNARRKLYHGEHPARELPRRSEPTRQRTLVRSTPQRANTDHPSHPFYPDQAHSALQLPENIHRSTYHARNTSTQSQTSFVLPPSASPRLEPHLFVPPNRLARTAGNTPAQTPGLFQLATPIQPFKLEGTGEHILLPSPYLHPVQAPPPRTTTSAAKDIDYYSGRKMINRYEIIDELGRGVYGKVKLARNLDNGEYVAIKIVQRFSKRKRLGRSSMPEDQVKKEIAILKKVQHPNVVRLIEVIDDPEIAKVYIVLEYCEQRELIWRTDGLPQIVLMEFWTQGKDSNYLTGDLAIDGIEKVSRIVKRRTQREDRQHLQAIREARDANLNNWSLTYASESDEDVEDSLNQSKSLASATWQDQILEDLEQPSSMQVLTHTPGQESHTEVPERVGADYKGPAAPTELDSSKSLEGGFSFYSTEWYNGEKPLSRISSPSAYDRPRQTSVAESTSSGLTEHMENEVPPDFRYVPTMTLDECRSAFRDAVVGLDHLHYHGIIHRDIKPENLLRTHDNRIKISDFGVSYLGKPMRHGDSSAEVSETESTDHEREADFAKTVGTPAFYAPELCNLDTDLDAKMIKTQIDVWALGITLFCMVFARTPFDADNAFALMKRTREEEIFIPRQRLVAIDPTSRARTPGHTPLFQKNKRNPQDYVHEDVDEELYDLMKRLFQKDPAKRITVKEIKHHVWTVRDIPDPGAWIDETDPSRLEHGEKIQVSTEDVEKAVMPIIGLDRIKSFGKRALSAMGIGRRKRNQSSVSSSDAGSSTSISDPILVSHERRMSVQPQPLAPIPQRPTREPQGEHPLSRSVTASPDPEDQQPRDVEEEESLSPMSTANNPQSRASIPMQRPCMPNRHASDMSTTGSVRTIRPSDTDRGRRTSTSPPASDMPGPDASVPPPSTLSSIFRGAGTSFFRAMGSRDRLGSGSGSASPNRSSSVSHEPTQHGRITTGVSNTSASGQLNFPVDLNEKLSALSMSREALESSKLEMRSSNSSGTNTSQPSRQHSTVTVPLAISPSMSSPRAQTPAQMTSPASQSPRHSKYLPVDLGGGVSSGQPAYVAIYNEATEDEYRNARAALARRRELEYVQERERSEASTPSSALGSKPCPPSPDDNDVRARDSSVASHAPASAYFSFPNQSRPSMTSSEDPSPSDATHSRSTSFPSVPSAVSADSSIYSDAQRYEDLKNDSANSSGGTIDTKKDTRTDAQTDTQAEDWPETRKDLPRNVSTSASDDGYQGDGDGNGETSYAVESDSDSESEEEFLVMNHKKGSPDGPGAGQVSRMRERRERNQAERKASRSGSTNTMKKVSLLSEEELPKIEDTTSNT